MSRKQPLDYSHLTPEERLDPALKLRESLEAGHVDNSLTPAQRAELERRLAEDEENPDEGEPWEAVRDEILRDLARDRAAAA
jgi:putative addiction module component (TIGR02574 family)